MALPAVAPIRGATAPHPATARYARRHAYGLPTSRALAPRRVGRTFPDCAGASVHTGRRHLRSQVRPSASLWRSLPLVVNARATPPAAGSHCSCLRAPMCSPKLMALPTVAPIRGATAPHPADNCGGSPAPVPPRLPAVGATALRSASGSLSVLAVTGCGVFRSPCRVQLVCALWSSRPALRAIVLFLKRGRGLLSAF
jgi:hypothetical protein